MNAIQRLEVLPGMSNEDKASVLLVYGNLKPSAFVLVHGEVFHLEQGLVHIEPQLIAELKDVLKDLNLKYSLETVIMENASNVGYEHGQEVLRIFVADTQQIADELRAVFDGIQNKHVPAGHPLGRHLSRENWQEEVKYVQPVGQYIKLVSPKIYEAITREL